MFKGMFCFALLGYKPVFVFKWPKHTFPSNLFIIYELKEIESQVKMFTAYESVVSHEF